MKLKNKLILTFLAIGIVPTLIIGFVATIIASDSLEQQAFSQLISVRDIKKSQIQDYFQQRKNDITILASNIEQTLDFTSPETLKDTAHQQQELFSQYIEKYDYYDLFLINESGDIFYTVTKEADYQTNIVSGEYNDSGLGELFKKVTSNGEVSISDFSRYAPSNNDPAAFIALPFKDTDNNLYVIALQLSIERINHIMTQRSGMGETGESYLIGADLLMRSDSFLDPKGHSVKASFSGDLANNGVNTLAARAVIKGDTDSKVIIDYNGNPVLSAYTPIEFDGVLWGLLSEIDVAEALQSINTLKWNIFYILLGCIVITVISARACAKSIIKPLGGEPQEMRRISETIALGDLAIDFSSHHESESVYGAMKRMTLKLKELINKIIDNSQNLASVSEQTSSLSLQSSTSLKHQQSNIEMIATAVEQMSITIDEVAQSAANVANSTQLAKDSAIEANGKLYQTINDIDTLEHEIDQANTVIKSLENDARDIGNVLEVIRSIAEQTNLLALNAAIEAARAGEQGRGFAVVADEVRTLASKTQDSTANIENMISKLQNASNNAVAAMTNSRSVCENTLKNAEKTSFAIKKMTSEIDNISDMTALIASSVEEQSSVSKEITQSVMEINDVAFENSSSAEQVSIASQDIYSVADALKQLALKFKTA